MAKQREAALAAQPQDMALIISLNTESQLRMMLAAGAVLQPMPTRKRRGRR